MSLRDKAKQKFRESKLPAHWDYYKSLRNFTTLCIRNEKKAYLEHKLNTTNPKVVWKELRSLNIVSRQKNCISDHLADANSINSFFIDSVPKLNADCDDLVEYYNNCTVRDMGSVFEFQLVDPHTVSKALNSIVSGACGADGLTIQMIKLCCPYIIQYITHIINSCILDATFPDAWKEAMVVPVPKCNNPSELRDLRPVSLLPVLSKVFERIISWQLRDHLACFEVLPEYQSGFRPNHSCTTALLNVTDNILSSADNSKLTLLVLLDFSKAFDTLNHNILLSILHYIGFKPNAVNLMRSYLSDRKQFVKFNNLSSSSIALHAGVAQGSIVGPLLFSIYTTNLFQQLQHCKVHMYADDTQLEYSFNTEQLNEAVSRVNHDLETVAKISTAHQLQLNASKSIAMIFGKMSDCSRVKDEIVLSVGSDRIQLAESVRNLGLTMDNQFRYRGHVSKCIQRAFSNLKVLYPHRHYLSQKTKSMLSQSMVLSHFSYCSPVYAPAIDAHDRDRIQRAQNACLRFIFGIRKYEHISHKLSELGWLNMQNRFKLQRACLYHKIINSRSPPYLYNKISFRTDVHHLNVRNKGLITPPLHRSALYERSFSYSIYKTFNSIPESFKSLSAPAFRVNMKRLLLTSQCSG